MATRGTIGRKRRPRQPGNRMEVRPGKPQGPTEDRFTSPVLLNPGALGPAPLPMDPTFDNQTSLNRSVWDSQQAGFGYDRARVENEYGFVDTSNPYNRAAMLERSFKQGQDYTQNSMASRGQLYSGANQSMQDENRFQYSRDYDSLRRQYDDSLHNISEAEKQAFFDFTQGNIDAGQGRLDRAAANPLAPPVPVTGRIQTELREPQPRRKPQRLTGTYRRRRNGRSR